MIDRLLLVGLVSLVVLMCGCTHVGSALFKHTHKPYRTSNTPDTDQSTVRKLKTDRGEAHLAFLEFDDQGEPWRTPNPPTGWKPGSRTQLAATLERLESLTKRGPVRTIVFIHGWNNNAKEGNGNLVNFERSLKEIAAVSSPPVFGVFVSWRGKISNRSIFVDVASREAAASRIGGPPLLAYLQAIGTATRKAKGSSVIAIGHSFGAKILVQVAFNHLASQIGEQLGKVGQKTIVPIADTVILANTAEDSRLPLQMMNLMRDSKLIYTNEKGRPLPLVVSVCSLEDKATLKLLPIWNNVARNWLGLPHKGGGTSNRIQDRALFNAMGFYGPLRTHTLASAEHPTSDHRSDKDWSNLLRANTRAGRKWPLQSGSSLEVALTLNGDPDKYTLHSVDKVTPEDFGAYADKAQPNETPLWFVQVPGFVSDGHGDLWNPNFTGLIVALESMKSSTTSSGSVRSLPPISRPQIQTTPVN